MALSEYLNQLFSTWTGVFQAFALLASSVETSTEVSRLLLGGIIGVTIMCLMQINRIHGGSNARKEDEEL